LQRLLKAPEEAEALGRAGAARAAAEFALDAHVRRVVALYEDVRA
jgi:hypothetical protein